MKSRRWRIMAGVFAVAALAAGLWAYLVHSRGARALAAYKRQLIASGERMDLDSILPRRLPATENGVGVFRQAGAAWHSGYGVLTTNMPWPMRMVAPGKAMVMHAQERDYFGATNAWEELEAAVAANETAFSHLEELIKNPNLDFQIDYRLPIDFIPFFHLPDLKRAAQMENTAALYDLHRGDARSAVTRLRVILALVQGEREECLVISQLVRIAMTHIAVAGNWELLQSPAVQDRELELLQNDWLKLDFIPASEASLVFLRIKEDELFDQMRQSSANFRKAVSASGPAPGASWYERLSASIALKTKENLWRVALSYPDQLRAMKGQQVLIEAVRQAGRERCFAGAFKQADAAFSELGLAQPRSESQSWWARIGDVDISSLGEDSVLSLQKFLRRVYASEAARQIVVAAIALKRFQLAHGKLPLKLEELVPEFLAKVPTDPMDGQPLRYRMRPDGSFLLYSIGTDGHDDNGNPLSKENRSSFSWQLGEDLVWPQPASAEEIETFLKREKKLRY